MEITPEIQEFTLNYLRENPKCTANKLGAAINKKFPNLPACRKTGNQVLYRMEKIKYEKESVVCDRSEGKPKWSVVNSV